MATLVGLAGWSLKRDEKGYRTYLAKWLVKVDDIDDGPGTVINAAGLPTIGSTWNIGNDSDPYCYCRPDWTLEKLDDPNEPDLYWIVETPFSNTPGTRCQDSSIDDPLAEPIMEGGGFAHYKGGHTRSEWRSDCQFGP